MNVDRTMTNLCAPTNTHTYNFNSGTATGMNRREKRLGKIGLYHNSSHPCVLTEEGILQAGATGRRLQTLIANNIQLGCHRTVHSGQTRAKQTAEEICSNLQPQPRLVEDVLLNEGHQ